MQIRQIGWIMICIAIVLTGIVFLFKSSMEEFIYTTCPLLHNTDAIDCPATKTLNQQSYLAYFLVSIIALMGIVLATINPEQKIIIRTKPYPKEKIKLPEINDLTNEEKKLFNIIQKEKAIFQAELIEKIKFSKAKVTRILDKLENRKLIERKRRGLTNIVVLK
ncbi:MarR family transcriptional regulator [Candidatus Pacearchaeota archaeon]|nr:MarR family transcriptional regulator [Candidatus Pacearchaeota archaeon]